MNPPKKTTKRELAFTAKNIERIEALKKRYPTNRAVLLPALHIAQEQFEFIDEAAMMCVASAVGIPPIWVYEATTFYTMYHQSKPGKTCINVCTSIACYLRGSDEMLEYLSKKLNIEIGDTTADGRFTLKAVECLANCDHGPMAQVNDDYKGLLTQESIDALIDSN